PHAQHLAGFAQHELDQPRILVYDACKILRACAGNDIGKSDAPAFRLRHDFLRDDEHVALLQREIGVPQGPGKQFPQVRAALDFRQAGQGAEDELSHDLLSPYQENAGATSRMKRSSCVTWSMPAKRMHRSVTPAAS